MPLFHNTAQLIINLNKKAADLKSKSLKEALTRIALKLQADIKLNIIRKHLIDKGRLLNSISYEFFGNESTQGVRIGSYSVPYAAVHEFGYHGTQHARAFNRRQSMAWGRAIKPRVVRVKPFSRKMDIRARPYLRPAFLKNRNFILMTMRDALAGK